MMDNEVDFGDILLDAPEEAQPAKKLSLKPRVKPRKPTFQYKSSAPNPAAKNKDGKTGVVTQGGSWEELGNSRERASLTCPARETVDDTTCSQGTLDRPSKDVPTVPSVTLDIPSKDVPPSISCSAVGTVSQDDEHLDDSSKSGTHHQRSVVSDVHASPDSLCGKTLDDVVDFGETSDAPGKEETVSKLKPKVPGKLPKLATKSRKTKQKMEASNSNAVTENERNDTNQVGLENDHVQAPGCHESSSQTLDSEAFPGAELKGKGKSVSFVLPDASEWVVSHKDTTSVMDDFSSFCDDLYSMPQTTAGKEHADNWCPYPEEEPSSCAVEQPKSNVGEIGSSRKLRSRRSIQKARISQHTAEDYLDEDFVEASTSDQDNDPSVDYSAGSKRKSRDGVEEEQQQGVQTDKCQVSSRGRKKKSKDAPTQKTEKKLSHRIRQKRMKELEVKTLLETPHTEYKKLNAAQLRLLQEAKERIPVKENLPGPSSNPSFQHENPDDFDCNGYDETENFNEDRTHNNGQNVTKLNYHSYMNRQPRSKWSKSETDLFYQGLRQFGSDFAMIQQLFPDKTRHHVRQKFKAEEKKNPMLIHDALICRSGDNSYFKKVIKKLNIEDVIPDCSSARKQDVTSSGGPTTDENAPDDFNEENSSNRVDKEHDMNLSDEQEEEHVPENSDDLNAVFDWY